MRPSACLKCGKTRYGIEAATIGACSRRLERELALFRGPASSYPWGTWRSALREVSGS